MVGALRRLTVVLLAGGPGGSTAKDILAATAEPPHVESRLAHRKQLLRGAKGSEYVATGLAGRRRMATASGTGHETCCCVCLCCFHPITNKHYRTMHV
jgi:hypothetical protein